MPNQAFPTDRWLRETADDLKGARERAPDPVVPMVEMLDAADEWIDDECPDLDDDDREELADDIAQALTAYC